MSSKNDKLFREMYFFCKGKVRSFLCSRVKAIILIFFSISLIACSPYHQFKDSNKYAVENDKKNGLVVLSFTKSGVSDVPFTLLYKGIDAHNRSVSGRIPILGKNDWTAPRRSYDVIAKGNTEGRVVTLKLPAGKYEFFDLYIEFGYRGAEWMSGREFSIPFTSSSSTTEYAGNVHVWSKDSPVDGLFYEHYRNDERVRDITVFREKFPSVQKINYSIFSSAADSVALSRDNTTGTSEYLDILVIEPTDAEAHKNRAALYLGLESYSKALYHANKAISLNSKLADAYVYRSIVYFVEEKNSKGFSDVNTAIKYDPDNALGLLIRSVLYYSIGNERLAKADYEKALSVDPNVTKKFGEIPEVKSIIERL